jgi:hypothetical protein
MMYLRGSRCPWSGLGIGWSDIYLSGWLKVRPIPLSPVVMTPGGGRELIPVGRRTTGLHTFFSRVHFCTHPGMTSWLIHWEIENLVINNLKRDRERETHTHRVRHSNSNSFFEFEYESDQRRWILYNRLKKTCRLRNLLLPLLWKLIFQFLYFYGTCKNYYFSWKKNRVNPLVEGGHVKYEYEYEYERVVNPGFVLVFELRVRSEFECRTLLCIKSYLYLITTLLSPH